jgi:pimeloyl-ACP methyl ester carboxylesterase
MRDLRLAASDAPFGGRVPVLVPRSVPSGTSLPLVIALHGLGEAQDPVLAAKAWPALYGLLDAAERLASPPLAPRGKRGDLTVEHAATINRDLSSRPHAGVLVACPFTPNPSRARDREAHLQRYATWIRGTVVVRAREQLPALSGANATHLAGCSMGGAVALEVAERCRGSFASLALVQSAHGAHRNATYATNARTAGPAGGSLATLVLTSAGDPFRERNVALGKELARAGVPHDVVVLPGPHDQPWLREAGTPTLLHWLDRRPRA